MISKSELQKDTKRNSWRFSDFALRYTQTQFKILIFLKTKLLVAKA